MRLSEKDLITICENEAKNEITAAKYIVRINRIIETLKGDEDFIKTEMGSYAWFVKIFDKWQLEVLKSSAKRGMSDYRAYLVPIRYI